MLDTLRIYLDEFHLFYWRDKSGKEIDFILDKNIAFEVKETATGQHLKSTKLLFIGIIAFAFTIIFGDLAQSSIKIAPDFFVSELENSDTVTSIHKALGCIVAQV